MFRCYFHILLSWHVFVSKLDLFIMIDPVFFDVFRFSCISSQLLKIRPISRHKIGRNLLSRKKYTKITKNKILTQVRSSASPVFKFYIAIFVSFFRLNRFQTILDRPSGLILSSFKGNMFFFLPTSESHKLLKILLETIVQVFYDNNFFFKFFSRFFFGLISFGLYYFGLMVTYCAFRWAKKFVYACLCFEGEGT